MQSDEASIDRSEAKRTIVDVERLRRSTRHALNPVWYPNVGFGLFFIGTAAVVFLELGTTTTLVYSAARRALDDRPRGAVLRARRAIAGRAERNPRPIDPVVLALVIGVVAANVLAEGDASAFAPTYVAAAGIVALGIVLRDRVELAAGVAIASWPQRSP